MNETGMGFKLRACPYCHTFYEPIVKKKEEFRTKRHLRANLNYFLRTRDHKNGFLPANTL